MRIPEKTLNKWKKKKEHGTIEKIATKTGLHRNTVSGAFKGYAAQSTIDIINEYFEKKE